jgi:hypothetical protein
MMANYDIEFMLSNGLTIENKLQKHLRFRQRTVPWNISTS